MKTRIRDKWRQPGRTGSVEENAVALAYVLWQLSLVAAKNLHAERFDYTDDRQRVNVILEYLVFLVHVADRLVYGRLPEDARREFITRLASASAEHLQRNAAEVIGAGDHAARMLDLLNERGRAYAQCRFDKDGDNYQFLRLFGASVQGHMGESQNNRWVIDQIMEIDAPEAIDKVAKSLENIFATSKVALDTTATGD